MIYIIGYIDRQQQSKYDKFYQLAKDSYFANHSTLSSEWLLGIDEWPEIIFPHPHHDLTNQVRIIPLKKLTITLELSRYRHSWEDYFLSLDTRFIQEKDIFRANLSTTVTIRAKNYMSFIFSQI